MSFFGRLVCHTFLNKEDVLICLGVFLEDVGNSRSTHVVNLLTSRCDQVNFILECVHVGIVAVIRHSSALNFVLREVFVRHVIRVGSTNEFSLGLDQLDGDDGVLPRLQIT